MAYKTFMTIMATSMRRMLNLSRMAFDAGFIFMCPSIFWQFIRGKFGSQFSMMRRMFGGSHQGKIVGPIIKAIVVYMMNDFTFLKWTANYLLHNHSMFIFPPATIRKFNCKIIILNSPTSNRVTPQASPSYAIHHFFFGFFRPIWFWRFTQSKTEKISKSCALFFDRFLTSYMTWLERCSSWNWISHKTLYAI